MAILHAVRQLTPGHIPNHNCPLRFASLAGTVQSNRTNGVRASLGGKMLSNWRNVDKDAVGSWFARGLRCTLRLGQCAVKDKVAQVSACIQTLLDIVLRRECNMKRVNQSSDRKRKKMTAQLTPMPFSFSHLTRSGTSIGVVSSSLNCSYPSPKPRTLPSLTERFDEMALPSSRSTEVEDWLSPMTGASSLAVSGRS